MLRRKLSFSSLFIRSFSSHILRDFQKECIDKCSSYWKIGKTKQLVLLPVASGKTLIMANLINKVYKENKKKILVLAHRRELLYQIKETLLSVNKDLQIGLDISQSIVNLNKSDIILASVQTLGKTDKNRSNKPSKRLLRYPIDILSGLFIDEAHHAPARSYTTIIDYFKGRKDSKFILWGCTATPFRSDAANLLDIFKEVVYEKHIVELMNQNYLCSLIPISICNDSTTLPVTKEDADRLDFELNKLTEIINTESRNQLIIDSYEKYILPSRKATIIFACNLDHCEELYLLFHSFFNNLGYNKVPVVIVKGSTDLKERAHILSEFKQGNIKVLINCGVFTEGTNIPNIDSIIIARPTLSSILYYQMIGRGLRQYPGKDNCLVLDIVDKIESNFYSVVTSTSLFGINNKEYSTNSKNISDTLQDIKTLKNEEKNNNNADKDIILPKYEFLEKISNNSNSFEYSIKDYINLDWMKIVNANTYILPLYDTFQFGLIQVERKRIRKASNAVNYSWKTGYTYNHTISTNLTDLLQPTKDIRYQYTAKFLTKTIVDNHYNTTIIGISDNINTICLLSEEFIQKRYPESWDRIQQSAPWRQDIWTDDLKLKGLGIPSEYIVDPNNKLTKDIVQFFRDKQHIENLLLEKRKVTISQLTKEHYENNPYFNTFYNTKCKWLIQGSTKVLLPFSYIIPHFIEIKEYYPCQYQVTHNGYYSSLISIQSSSKHLTKDNKLNAIENLKDAFIQGEAYIKNEYQNIYTYKYISNKWKQHEITENQKNKIEKFNINTNNIKTKEEASLMITSAKLYYRSLNSMY